MGGFPAGPFASGLARGAGIGQMLLRSMLEREEFERAKEQQDRRAQMDDIQTQMLLQSSGRAVEGGTVEDRLDLPLFGALPVRRKSEAARTVRYKTRDGQTIERELFTPEEQAARHLESERAQRKMVGDQRVDEATRIENARAGARRKQSAIDLEEQGLPLSGDAAKLLGVPAGRKIMPAQLDDLLRAQATLEQLRGGGPDPLMHVQNLTDDAGEVTQVRTTKGGKVAQTKLGRLGKSRSAGATAGQEATEGRFRQRRIDAAQKEHDTADAQEQTLHAEAKGIGERLKAIHTEINTARDNENAKGEAELHKERRKLEARLPQVREQAKALNARKQAALSRKETLRGSDKGRIRVKLADGRVGMIDAGDFDAKTMKRM